MKSNGLFLPVFSLPGRFGGGRLDGADKFIRFLRQAGQKYWLVLPFHAKKAENPFLMPSVFGGNTDLIDLFALSEEKWIDEYAFDEAKKQVSAEAFSDTLLREASKNFFKENSPADYIWFLEENDFWLENFALYTALKRYFGGKDWRRWDDVAVKMRKADAVAYYADMLYDETEHVKFCQYVFFRQWRAFHAKLSAAGITLIGTFPLLSAADSAEVWANGKFFETDKGDFAGYNLTTMKKDRYDWWKKRLLLCQDMYDGVLLDGFSADLPMSGGKNAAAAKTAFLQNVLNDRGAFPVFVQREKAGGARVFSDGERTLAYAMEQPKRYLRNPFRNGAQGPSDFARLQASDVDIVFSYPTSEEIPSDRFSKSADLSAFSAENASRLLTLAEKSGRI